MEAVVLALGLAIVALAAFTRCGRSVFPFRPIAAPPGGVRLALGTIGFALDLGMPGEDKLFDPAPDRK
jgi:hypothetical protein